MSRPKIDWRFAAALAMCAAAGARADDQVQWRFWGVRDGFAETYTYRLSVTPNGNAYARHGAVRTMSIFDGYGVTRIPEPRQSAKPYWPAESRVYACPGCTPWVVSEGELREYKDGRWVTHYTPPAGERLVGAVPTGERVVVVAETGLRQYAPATRTWHEIEAARHTQIRPFLQVAASRSGEIWIAGEHGLARLRVAEDGGPYEWTEIVTDSYGFTHFSFPEPGEPGELFAQAVSGKAASGL